jgi:hypothetical protein
LKSPSARAAFPRDAAFENHAGLGVALGADTQNAGLGGKEVDHRRGLFGGDQEIDVADGLAAAAMAPAENAETARVIAIRIVITVLRVRN